VNEDRLDAIAADLDDAWTRAVAIPAPTTIEPELTTRDAYLVQEQIIGRRLGSGRRRSGWKLGLTSAGPDVTPIVGTLLDDMIVESGARLSLTTMVAPLVEAEVVVRIGEDIDRSVTVADLMAGQHSVGPGIEVIDYRTVDSTGAVDWIADNSTVAYAVVGNLVPVSSVNPATMAVSLSGQTGHLATGRGDLVMGDPMAAVAWLSGHLAERGHRLEKGAVILTGSLTGHHPVLPGRSVEFRAAFDGFEPVTVGFDA